ncbi:MAG TPA: thioredoxin domain-containing protein [Halanaerobiales bacterium]|nr:thioredoxin domain-containing protein [Halanaerobiales bacterium]
MLELNKDNFESEVLDSEGVVLVDYWSDNCDLCLDLMPDVEELAEKYGDKIKFAKLNIKGNRRLAIGQKVLGLPSLVFYEDGEKKEHLSGDELEPEDIEEVLKKYYEQA